MNITNPRQLIIGILAVIGLLCVLSKLDFFDNTRINYSCDNYNF